MSDYGSQGIQGHHLFVQGLMDQFGVQFAQFLPGWDVNGEYNFAARASNNKIAAQLNIRMHSGSKPRVGGSAPFARVHPLHG